MKRFLERKSTFKLFKKRLPKREKKVSALVTPKYACEHYSSVRVTSKLYAVMLFTVYQVITLKCTLNVYVILHLRLVFYNHTLL